jgi:hypothetical protein
LEYSEMLRWGITSGRSDFFQFFWGDIHLQAPTRYMRALLRQYGIKWLIGRGKGSPEPRQFIFRRDPVQFEQVPKATRLLR